MAGYSGTPLARKLGIGEGNRVGWTGGPDDFAAALDLPASVIVDQGFAGPRRYDVIVVFLPALAALAGTVERFSRQLNWNGGLWLAWPKLSGRLAGDIREADVRRAGLAGGLVDNKICAIDRDWSGLRFVYRKEDRPR
ncbi:MAG: DUF3052 domain-containing protein [Gemmatimonadetes bacterium]|nr:DUF3052 domain-containing protein [Gemmatimonadota bacterium]